MEQQLNYAQLRQPMKHPYESFSLSSSLGNIESRLYISNSCITSHSALIILGEVSGNFESPARDLYPRLSEELLQKGIPSLHVKFRNPTQLEDSVQDALEAIKFFKSREIDRVALIGHSFSGPVAIQAAALSDTVKTVITLSTQTYGTEAVAQLNDTPLLLIHGSEDRVLNPRCSFGVYQAAKDPKELKFIPGGHSLQESADEVHRLIWDWLFRKFLNLQ